MSTNLPTRTDAAFLAACKAAKVTPEVIFGASRTEQRNAARRAVCCRLLDAGWKPSRIAALYGINRQQIHAWARTCPPCYNVSAWRPPPGLPDATLGRKWRRMRQP